MLTLALVFSPFCETLHMYVGILQCHVELSVEADSDADSIKLIYGAEADQTEKERS